MIHLKTDMSSLKRLCRRYPKAVASEGMDTMRQVVTRGESEVVRRTPAGVGGAAGLRGSIAGEAVAWGGAAVRGAIGTPLEYGPVVEMGRRPGKMPPVEPIALWAQRKLGVPEEFAHHAGFLIARKIAVKGTKGAKMFETGWAAIEKWAMGLLKTVNQRVAGRCNRGD